jgi:tripartite-type tricarboxylate transporter receptor subunit TctC
MMKVRRRDVLSLAAAVVTLPCLSRAAWPLDYPARPVRLIVATGAGGSPDIVARLIGQWLSEKLGQPFVVDNRPGATTNIGTELALKAPPDGGTLLFATSSSAINPALYRHLNFNFVRDAEPVASIARIPLVMEINPRSRQRQFLNSSPTPRPTLAR